MMLSKAGGLEGIRLHDRFGFNDEAAFRLRDFLKHNSSTRPEAHLATELRGD